MPPDNGESVLTLYIGAIGTCMTLRVTGCHPGWRSHPGVQFLDIGLDLCDDLNSTGTGTHNRHTLILQVKALWICCSMSHDALELMQAINIFGPMPIAR